MSGMCRNRKFQIIMANFVRPDNPVPSDTTDTPQLQQDQIPEEGDFENESESLENVESLVKGIEEIQDHCLNQHELHLDYRAELIEYEEKIEKVCQSIKSYKIKNEETEYQLQKLKCQNQELKSTIARESGMCLAAEEKRESIQRQIDDKKQDFIKFVEEHEKNMAVYSEKLRKGPINYSEKELKEQTVQETQEVEEFNEKKAELMEELNKVISQLELKSEQLKEEVKKNEMELEETENSLTEQLILKQNLIDKIQVA
ncbi:hypothetical protein B566_EDAN002007 [Ephemera danica]|nr:hypothetical protein B566_EDAN002007 [Ephemera danica]